MADGYTIYGLKVEGLGNVELVEVKLEGKKFVVFEGPNGAGKTTMLDAIYAALLGPKHFTAQYGKGYPVFTVINNEGNAARIKVTLGNGERTIEVKRRIGRGDDGKTTGQLVIKASDGKELDQRFLDDMISEVTIDPSAFALMDAKQQVATLRPLTGLDYDALDKAVADAEEKRKDKAGELRIAKAKVTEEPERFQETPITELLAKKKEIEAWNLSAKEEQEDVDESDATVKNAEEELEAARTALREAEENVRYWEAETVERKRVRETMPAPRTPKDVDAVDHMIATADERNQKARKWKAWKENQDAYAQADANHQAAEKEVQRVRAERQKKITDAKLPFPEVELTDEGVLVNGVMFVRLSDAEKIRVGAQIAIAMNPGLRVIRITKGSLMDDAGLEVLRKVAEKNDCQILVERVSDDQGGGPDTIVMRAGRMVREFDESPSGKDSEKQGTLL